MLPSEEQKQRIADAIRRVLDGDRNAYEAIYALVDRPLRAFLRSQCGYFGDDFVDEVALRTHLSASQDLHRYDLGRSSLVTWVIWLSRNVARQVRRERYPPREVRYNGARLEAWAATSTGPAEEYEVRRRERVVREEMESLAGDGRDAVELHDLQGRTFEDTARVLGISVGRVRRERDKALVVLSRRLQERGVHATVRDITPVLQVWGWDDSGYDDDWTCTVGAIAPDEPQGPLFDENKEETPP